MIIKELKYGVRNVKRLPIAQKKTAELQISLNMGASAMPNQSANLQSTLNYLKDHLGNNRVVINTSGTATVQEMNYYPFGMAYLDRLSTDSKNPGLQPYKYNGKEYDTMYGLNWYDYHARQKMGLLPGFTTMDPLCEKYPWISPYAYCGNNPVNAIDPDGRDYTILFNRDDDGNIIGMTIQAKVYITGTNASAERASDLNKLAKDTYKSQTIDGISVSFDINYEYNKDITSANLGQGENLLDFNDKVTTDYDRSFVHSSKRGDLYLTGNTGEIYSDANNNTVMHETGHLIGLSDRYEVLDGGNLGGRSVLKHPGFENDLMSGGGMKINKNYYSYYLLQYGGTTKRNIVNGKILVDRNNRGFLMTPYARGKLHRKNSYAVDW